MKIKSLYINNWRSIKEETIEFQDLMIFIGQNNCGKSNILKALQCFFQEYSHKVEDLNDCNDDCIIEIVFENLDDQDKNSNFKSYVTIQGELKVRMTAKKEGKKVQYNGYKQIPTEDWLKKDKAGEYNTKTKIESTPLIDFLDPNHSGRVAKALFEDLIDRYIEAHPDTEMNYELETTNFLGDSRIGGNLFGDLIFIPAVRDANDELGNKGIFFSELYSRVINKISQTDEHYINAKTQLQKLSSLLNPKDEEGNINTRRPAALTDLEKRINDQLSFWRTNIDVEIEPPDLDNIFRVGAKVSLFDGIKTDIERKGHGLQRTLIFCLLKSYADVLREEKINLLQTPDTPTRKNSNSTYFVFEEPELFLHPQAQRQLFDSLKTMSENDNQVILCTHSSSFLEIENYKSISIVKKNESDGTKITQYLQDILLDNEKENFNIRAWLNPERNELFFADKIVLVEGPTEKAVIPYLSNKLGILNHNFTFIECEGKGGIKTYIKLFNKFKLKYIAIYDNDNGGSGSQDIETQIDPTLGKQIIMMDDLEDELQIRKVTKGKPLHALTEVSAINYVLPNQIKTKIESIYT